MSNWLLTRFNTEDYQKYYRAGFWRDDTIYALVRNHAERTPDRIAIRSAQGDLSYRALIEQTDAFASELESRDVIAGERVAVWLPSRPETVITLLACSRNGYVCCPSLQRDHTVGVINPRETLQRLHLLPGGPVHIPPGGPTACIVAG
jgi:acyl-CoA synthetase